MSLGKRFVSNTARARTAGLIPIQDEPEEEDEKSGMLRVNDDPDGRSRGDEFGADEEVGGEQPSSSFFD